MKSRKSIFVRDAYCISPQKTGSISFFEEPSIIYTGNRYVAVEPAYGSSIPSGMLRRMGKAVRMGVGAGLPLITAHPDLDGIVLGTANGGLEDCLKFLNQIVDYNEGTLTPTNFVQSTPNAISGGLALMSKNTGYNVTHVHKGLAFECALADAMLLIRENRAASLLVGGVEEISDYNYNIDLLAGLFKSETVTSETLLQSGTRGTVCGEGAAMFVIAESNGGENSAEIVDVDQVSFVNKEMLSEKLMYFLDSNETDAADIDGLVLGYSGDAETDFWYNDLLRRHFAEIPFFTFKNLVGDYPTSSSFALWMAIQIIAGRTVPGQESSGQAPRNVLIYNHYKGLQHGFILIKAVS
jgi:hypothetical protein